jgi:hypothetical protein
MVKQINVYFDDNDHKNLEEKKGSMSWHDFIMLLLNYDLKGGKPLK